MNTNIAGLTSDQIQAMMSKSPFITFLGLTVAKVDTDAGELVMSCKMRPEFERGEKSNQWHGGPIAAIIDTIGDYALVMSLRRPVPTISFSVDYLRPAIGTDLTAVARVRRSGKSVGTVDVDVLGESSNQLVAIGRAVYSTLPVDQAREITAPDMASIYGG